MAAATLQDLGLEETLADGLEPLPVHPASMVVFGATGELARRKLLPAIYNLAHDGALPEPFNLVGVARSALSEERFRELAADAVREFSRRRPDERVLERLLARARYLPGSFEEGALYEVLGGVLADLEERAQGRLDRLFYLASGPAFFSLIVGHLGAKGLSRLHAGEVRVVIEKPFAGTSADARRLNRELHSVLSESEVFRIDHRLGKETVQNLLALRFANYLLEPLWNRHHIDQVQISAAEDSGVEGPARCYDATGALRDTLQDHLLALLCQLACEPPVEFGAEQLRDERVKLLDAIEPPRPEQVPGLAVRARYAAGAVGGEPVPGYLEEEGVPSHSTTETYSALRLELDSWRWAGVPFYLRTGKRLARRLTEVVVTLKPVPELGFARDGSLGPRPNQLVLTFQPDEGVSLSLVAKIPGLRLRVRPVKMELLYGSAFLSQSPEAYERLVLDVLRGEATLFTRDDEVEARWRICEPILEAWRATSASLPEYAAGSQGPPEAASIMRPGHAWRRI